MSIILPNSRFQAPELFDGTKKPAVNVQIDWSNPVTEGLVGFWIFQNGLAINLVDGTIVSDTAGMTEADAETIAWDDAASTNAAFTLQSGFDFTSNATVIARVKKIGSEGWPMLFSMGSNPAATNDFVGMGYWNTGADLRTFFTGGSRITGVSVSRGNFLTGALTADIAANELKTHINGQYIVTDIISSSGLDFTKIDNITLFGSGTTEADQQGLYEGDYAIAFESTKTAEEVASLYDAPYQFLIPAVGPSLISLGHLQSADGLGSFADTSSWQPLTSVKLSGLGTLGSVDSFNDLSISKTVQLGSFAEASTFSALNSSKVIQLGSFSELSAFGSITSTQGVQLGALSESSAFGSLNAGKVVQLGSFGELTTFNAITSGSAVTLGALADAGAFGGITSTKTAVLNPFNDASAFTALSSSKTTQLGAFGELSVFNAVTQGNFVTLGAFGEASSFANIATAKAFNLTAFSTTDLFGAINASGGAQVIGGHRATVQQSLNSSVITQSNSKATITLQ